ncbi:BTB/POZ domain-containing protein 3-like [Sitodiplosis mosellana]|uniref:BTB/POZ domain-containing protein 3-like n=1 Tax=Sitodiplosis mosellana TaxID=263140 RepID=UPI0024441582|nr:BTB/POZ domain-containing protein 3-like [Sitodiplosis mosellana]
MSNSNYSSSAIVTAGKRMYLDTKMADVHFTFESVDGQIQRIPAIKSVLAATSKVFNSMFYGPIKEKDDVKITDASPAAFKVFLKFFYFDEIELTADNVAEVMNLGHKYDVTECLSACGKFIEDHLSNDNLWLAYGLAIFLNHEELKKMCEVTIAIDTGKLFKSPSFMDCDKKVLRNILKLDSLSCSETEVFDACMAWIKAASKQDTLTKELVGAHLGESFYDIRFGSMTMEDFDAIYMANDALFSTDEYQDIVRSITSKEYEAKLFKGKTRQCTWDQAAMLKCDRPAKEIMLFQEYDVSGFEKTTFSTSTTLLLREIVCTELFDEYEGPNVLCEDIVAKLTIIESGGPTQTEVITTEEVSVDIDSEDESTTFTEDDPNALYVDKNVIFTGGRDTVISLSKPIIIRRGIKYEIQLELDLESPCCSTIKFKSSKVQIEPGIIVKFHDKPAKNGDKVGIVRGLRFNKY